MIPPRIKKFLLSAFVVVSFGVYAFGERSQNAPTPPRDATSDSGTGTNPANLSNTAASTSNTASNSITNPSLVAPPAPKPHVAATPPPPPAPAVRQSGQHRDGNYTGNVANAYYGNIEVRAIVQGGKIADVQFLQYPNDRRTSIEINQQAMPYLKSEAIQVQSAAVDIVSGASDTSRAFIESLGTALASARNS